jgi:putative FmdB family regulatory protein
MPIYNVKCEECDSVSEILVRHSQVDENNNVYDASCPVCGNQHLVKLPSYEGSSFHLKGQNWFKTGGY